MEILLFSFEATAPIVLYLALGMFSSRLKLIDQETAIKVGSYCFQVFIPTLLFYSIYNIDFDAVFLADLVIFTAVTQVSIIVLLCLIFFSLIKDKTKAVTWAHVSYRSNFTMFGLGMAQTIYGAEGLQIVSMLVPVTLITFNFTAVILFSYCGATQNSSPKAMAKEVTYKIATNPLIVASIIALIISNSTISMPFVLYTTVSNVAAVTVPLALITSGAQIDLAGIWRDLKTVAALSCIRLIIIPLVVVPIAVFAGFRGVLLMAVYASVASPFPNAGAIMAQKYNIYPELSNQALAVTTLFGGFTAFIWITVLHYLQLL